MTDNGIQPSEQEGHRTLNERAAAARIAAQAAAERYVRVRRQSQITIGSSHELLAATHALREHLRETVTSYAVMLRRDDVLPERVIVLVKSAVSESDALRDRDHRAVLEDAVRWAVDAYYAA
jgi:hypothetical protein